VLYSRKKASAERRTGRILCEAGRDTEVRKMTDTARKSEAYEGMGKRIRERRGDLAMSQRDLSDESGVSADVIVKLEHDARRPRPSTVKRLANALGVGPEYLTTGRGRAWEAVAPMMGGPPGSGTQSVLSGAAEGTMVRSRAGERTRPKVEVRVSGAPDEAAAKRLEQMFERWMEEDEASGEPDRWPKIARAMDEDRTSYRKLFERG